MQEIKTFNLNLGPQHPAAHGVLRLVLKLIGEKINQADPHIGLLHRGTEKLIEQKTIFKALPYVDRLDYVSMFCNEHAFSQVIEKAGKICISLRSQYVRVLLLEITRILNHIMCLTTHAMDVGALTPFLWGFEEREKLMEIYERLSGARMHAAYIRPGGLALDLPKNVLKEIYNFCKTFNARIEELDQILSSNRIFKKRLSNIAVLNKKTTFSFSLSGPLIRSIGIPSDLRLTNPYEIYQLINYRIILGRNGDSYSRYFIRLGEMKESLKIIYWVINFLPEINVKTWEQKLYPTKKNKKKYTMEHLISHFTNLINNTKCNPGEFSIALEAPKGVLGVFIVINSERLIYRCKFRAPGFFHLQAFENMAKNHLISDAVAIIGTQDIVFGEVDR